MNVFRDLTGRSGARVLPRAFGFAPLHIVATRNRKTSMQPTSLLGFRPQSTSANPGLQSSGTPLEPFKTHPPSSYPGSPIVHSFYDDPSATWTFVTADPKTRKAIVVDPVLDYDPSSGKISQKSVKGLATFLKREKYEVVRICETHVHADHLTGAYALKTLLPEHPPIYIGSRVEDVQESFAPFYGLERDELEQAFDGFMHDGESFKIGSLTAVARGLPGHTPDSMGIQVGDTVFAGDSLFLPDVGTARVDFPGGDANALYASIKSLFQLSEDFRIFSGHDYPSDRDKSCFSTVADQLAHNKHVGGPQANLDTFVEMRSRRDASLGAPRLLHPSLQVNLRGGRMPKPDSSGQSWIRIPLSGELP